jgi:hypothetical protein
MQQESRFYGISSELIVFIYFKVHTNRNLEGSKPVLCRKISALRPMLCVIQKI